MPATTQQPPADLHCTHHECTKVGTYRCFICNRWNCYPHHDHEHGTCPFPRHA